MKTSTSKTRFITLLLAIVMVLGLAACSADSGGPVVDTGSNSTVITAPSPESKGLPGIPRGNGLPGIPRGGKTDAEKELKKYGNIETLTKSVKTPSKPDTNDTKVDNSYGIVDWSTAANGYITFTAKGRERGFIIQGPNNAQGMFKVANGDVIKIALTDGAGKYQYAIANINSKDNGYDIQYKNSFQVKSIDTDLAPYLVSTPYGDYENAPNATAKAKELWSSKKTQFENVKAITDWVCKLQYDKKLSHGAMDTYVNPDVVIERGGGICNDMSKLLVAMLRSQGVPAHYQCGTLDGKCHAWIRVWVEASTTTKNGVTSSKGAWINIGATTGNILTLVDYDKYNYGTEIYNYAN